MYRRVETLESVSEHRLFTVRRGTLLFVLQSTAPLIEAVTVFAAAVESRVSTAFLFTAVRAADVKHARREQHI